MIRAAVTYNSLISMTTGQVMTDTVFITKNEIIIINVPIGLENNDLLKKKPRHRTATEDDLN